MRLAEVSVMLGEGQVSAFKARYIHLFQMYARLASEFRPLIEEITPTPRTK